MPLKISLTKLLKIQWSVTAFQKMCSTKVTSTLNRLLLITQVQEYRYSDTTQNFTSWTALSPAMPYFGPSIIRNWCYNVYV